MRRKQWGTCATRHSADCHSSHTLPLQQAAARLASRGTSGSSCSCARRRSSVCTFCTDGAGAGADARTHARNHTYTRTHTHRAKRQQQALREQAQCRSTFAHDSRQIAKRHDRAGCHLKFANERNVAELFAATRIIALLFVHVCARMMVPQCESVS